MAPFIFVLLLFFTFPAHSETVLSSYELPNHDKEAIRILGVLFGIEHKKEGKFLVEIPASQEGLLRSISPDARLIEPDISAALRARLETYRQNRQSDARYHSFEEVQTWMKAQEKTFPDLAQVIEYGTSREGRKLNYLQISGEKARSLPKIMITAATHGDELITTEVLLHLADRLLQGYGKEDRITRILDSSNILFIPVVNPDGFVRVNRYDGNADPNRSYPYPQHENANPTPSIAAIMKLFASQEIKASIDFHAFGELIMYPWAYTHNPVESPYRSRFDALTSNMAQANRYTYGPISDVIYVAPGSSADFYFWRKKSLSLGIEIGDDKVPSPSHFPTYFESQEESTWRFLEAIANMAGT